MAAAPERYYLPRSPLARGALLVSLLLTLAILGYGFWRGSPVPTAPAVGGAFALTDQFGKPRTDAEFRGRYMLVFFGFTNCPDICPVALQTMTEALEALGPEADKFTPIFITVDPARDSVELLRDYAANFHPRLVALTGSEADIGKVAQAYRVSYAKVTGEEAPDDPAAYLLNHSAIVYLMGPDGTFLTHFGNGVSAADMAKGLRERL